MYIASSVLLGKYNLPYSKASLLSPAFILFLKDSELSGARSSDRCRYPRTRFLNGALLLAEAIRKGREEYRKLKEPSTKP